MRLVCFCWLIVFVVCYWFVDLYWLFACNWVLSFVVFGYYLLFCLCFGWYVGFWVHFVGDSVAGTGIPIWSNYFVYFEFGVCSLMIVGWLWCLLVCLFVKLLHLFVWGWVLICLMNNLVCFVVIVLWPEGWVLNLYVSCLFWFGLIYLGLIDLCIVLFGFAVDFGCGCCLVWV